MRRLRQQSVATVILFTVLLQPCTIIAMILFQEPCGSHIHVGVFQTPPPEGTAAQHKATAAAAAVAAHRDLPLTWAASLRNHSAVGLAISTCHSNKEGDVSICAWCKETFNQRHPLDAQDIQRSFLPGSRCGSSSSGGGSGMMPPDLLRRLQQQQEPQQQERQQQHNSSRAQPVVITVIGGSMTVGANCIDGSRSGLQCAWPQRVLEHLLLLFPNASITLHNKAQGGRHYAAWIESGELDGLVTEADVLLIDLQVNSQTYGWDAYQQKEDLDEFLYRLLLATHLQQRQVGVLFVESFRTCATLQADCNGHCPAHRQGHMTYNYTGQQKTYSWCDRWWEAASLERPIVQHYGLPIASYRDAVWPVLPTPSRLLPCFWNGWSHPSALGHVLMAQVVTHGLLQAILQQGACSVSANTPSTPSSSRSSSTSYNNGVSNGSKSSSTSSSTSVHPNQEFRPVGSDVTPTAAACSNGESMPGVLCPSAPSRAPVKFHQQLKGRRYCSVLPSISTGTQGHINGAAAAAASGGGDVALTSMSAAQPDAFKPVAAGDRWSFWADRPNKPGWICQRGANGNTNTTTAIKPTRRHLAAASPAGQAGPASSLNSHIKNNSTSSTTSSSTSSTASNWADLGDPSSFSSTIWFAVNFSSSPQLQLSYLTSYANIGAAEIALYKLDQTILEAIRGLSTGVFGHGSANDASHAAIAASWSSSSRHEPLAVYTIDAKITEMFSVPRTSFWVQPSALRFWAKQAHVHALPAAVQEGSYLIAVRPLMMHEQQQQANNHSRSRSSNFKLLALASC